MNDEDFVTLKARFVLQDARAMQELLDRVRDGSLSDTQLEEATTLCNGALAFHVERGLCGGLDSAVWASQFLVASGLSETAVYEETFDKLQHRIPELALRRAKSLDEDMHAFPDLRKRNSASIIELVVEYELRPEEVTEDPAFLEELQLIGSLSSQLDFS